MNIKQLLFVLLPLIASRSTGTAGEFERLKYQHPGLIVDLGVGLWAWPLPMDFDGDGDLDLVVNCPDKPSNGVYFFENASGDTAHNSTPGAMRRTANGCSLTWARWHSRTSKGMTSARRLWISTATGSPIFWEARKTDVFTTSNIRKQNEPYTLHEWTVRIRQTLKISVVTSARVARSPAARSTFLPARIPPVCRRPTLMNLTVRVASVFLGLAGVVCGQDSSKDLVKPVAKTSSTGIWPRFRGLRADGTTHEKLPTTWSETAKRRLEEHRFPVEVGRHRSSTTI